MACRVRLGSTSGSLPGFGRQDWGVMPQRALTMSDLTAMLTLADEYDESLRSTLRVVLVGRGGACVERSWGIKNERWLEFG